ncbi:MAG: DegT/DnrJ/EryC1/StrS family aminotransferase [Nanoarchaeota archaeon]|nr:DegT/DnrJ/EryC1/StrS family aminotransferase [Nanoarchaeota archaeon]
MRHIAISDFKVDDEGKRRIIELLDSGKISEGVNVREFEKLWAGFVGTKYAILTNSGTSALIAGLEAFKLLRGVPNGSKVITSPMTYVATSNAIVKSNLTPVYIDIDLETFSINPNLIREHLENNNPKDYSLILPVHLMGYPCDMDKINKIAKDFNLDVFEDSAQAHGTLYKGKRVGSLSLLSGFSFYMAHNIQVGELGAVTTDNLEIYKLIKKLKANGRTCDCFKCTRKEGYCPRLKTEEDFENDPRFSHDLIGYNFKTMEFQAVLGLIELKKVDSIIRKRQENVKFLNESLKDLQDTLFLPKFSKDFSYLAYPMIIKKDFTRQQIRMKLEANGIETRPMFGSIPTQQKSYSFLKKKYEGKLPNADFIGRNGFYISCHQFLEQEDLEYIVKVIKKIIMDG